MTVRNFRSWSRTSPRCSYPRLAHCGGGVQPAAARPVERPGVVGQFPRAVPIGRDVVVEVAAFDMVGRKFRNLRQAVKRTHNAGITTEIVGERELDEKRLTELIDVVRASPRGAHTDRGFYMNLDGILEGRFREYGSLSPETPQGRCRASTGMRLQAAVAISPLMCRGVAAGRPMG